LEAASQTAMVLAPPGELSFHILIPHSRDVNDAMIEH